MTRLKEENLAERRQRSANAAPQANASPAANTLPAASASPQASASRAADDARRCQAATASAEQPHAGAESGAKAAAPAAPSAAPAATPASPAATGIFGTPTLLTVVEPLLEGFAAADSDPVASVDSLLATLNLTRFLLADREAALAPGTLQRLCRARLEPLDAHLRRCMDGMWSQIQAAERRGGGGGSGTAGLTELQSSFTHIHLATDVTQRTIELCKSRGTT